MELLNRIASRIPGTEERVPRNTAPRVNERIEERMHARLEAIGQDPEQIDRRLAALDREWDIERTLEANAASAVLLGVGLGAFVSRRFFLLPAVVGGFLLQHAVQGWCPPVPVLRRLGFRTASEIERERDLLRARRGEVSADESAAE